MVFLTQAESVKQHLQQLECERPTLHIVVREGLLTHTVDTVEPDVPP